MLPVGGRVSSYPSAPPALKHQVRAAETEGQLGQDYRCSTLYGEGSWDLTPPPHNFFYFCSCFGNKCGPIWCLQSTLGEYTV